MNSLNNGTVGISASKIRLLAEKCNSNNLRSALIQLFAKKEGISLKILMKGRFVGPIIENSRTSEVNNLISELKPLSHLLTIKSLEGMFENLVDLETRRNQGAVYTPNYIVDYLIKNCVLLSSKNQKKIPSLCDPACGSGGFIIRAAHFYAKRFNISHTEAMYKYLVGFDINKESINQTGCLLELLLALVGEPLPAPDLRLHIANTLLDPYLRLFNICDLPEGFDVIVTNPPYVKLQNLSLNYRKSLLEKYKKFATGSFSLSPLFLIKGHKLLSSGGCLGFITQNNLFTSLAGKAVRQYLQDAKCIKRIIDFGHHKIFSKASAYTCLLFVTKKTQQSFQFVSFARSHHFDPQALDSINDFSDIDIGTLNADKWRLASSNHLSNLNNIENIGIKLGDLCKIRVGIATLKDSVFFTKKIGNRCIAVDADGYEFEIEEDVTKSIIKIPDFNDEIELKNNCRRVIFPYLRIGSKFSLIPEKVLRSTYPLTYNYLLANKKTLEKRDKGMKKYEAWYAWGRSQGMEAHGPKLLTKTFSARPNFILDKSDSLFCNGYAVFQPNNDLFREYIPIIALQRILNSSVMHYYAKLTSFQIEGDYQCYQKNFIERFGIPSLTKKDIKILLANDFSLIESLLKKHYNISDADLSEVLN